MIGWGKGATQSVGVQPNAQFQSKNIEVKQ